MHSVLLSLLEKFGIAYRISRKYQILRATENYDAPTANQLRLKAGDRIVLIKKNNQKWWTGIVNGMTGYFPGNLTVETSEPMERIYEDQSLIPCYLPEARPEAELAEFRTRIDHKKEIGRSWKFGFLSTAFFPQLMVRIFHFTNPELYWRTGFSV